MKRYFPFASILSILIGTLFLMSHSQTCKCDTRKTEAFVKSDNFRVKTKYDDPGFTAESFYQLPARENKALWYIDVESPVKTKFTSLWYDYASSNYHASHIDFIDHYKDRKDIELAFQFGPNDDLWAYHIFTVRKVDCCYLFTRSYFRHARFTSKRYAVTEKGKLDTLLAILDIQDKLPIPGKETYDYCGYFADNRNDREFYIDFNKNMNWIPSEKDTAIKTLKPSPSLEKLWHFVDKEIEWVVSYDL